MVVSQIFLKVWIDIVHYVQKLNTVKYYMYMLHLFIDVILLYSVFKFLH